jgi:hypothetical protein
LGYARALEAVDDLPPVGDQQQEVDRLSSNFRSGALAPIRVGRRQADTSMRNRVEHLAPPLLVSVEYREHVGKRWVGHDPGGAQRIGSVDEQVTKAQL